jgi:branched-subunit amino acid ABC-type transport system permease component
VINFAQGEMAMASVYVAYQLIQWGLSYWRRSSRRSRSRS